MVAGLRSLAKAMELPPAPTVRAPAPDPTDEREQETELSQTGLRRAKRKLSPTATGRLKPLRLFSTLPVCSPWLGGVAPCVQQA
jgi:hypothetical protein